MQPAEIIRLECLRLAVSTPAAERGNRGYLALAGEFESFVRGPDKAAVPAPGFAQPSRPQDKAPLRDARSRA